MPEVAQSAALRPEANSSCASVFHFSGFLTVPGELPRLWILPDNAFEEDNVLGNGRHVSELTPWLCRDLGLPAKGNRFGGWWEARLGSVLAGSPEGVMITTGIGQPPCQHYCSLPVISGVSGCSGTLILKSDL